MGLLADQVFVAPLAVRQQSEQITHGAAGHEESGFQAQIARQTLFQAGDGGVFAVDVIAQLGGQHGLTHGRGGLGDGIAAQIDHEVAP